MDEIKLLKKQFFSAMGSNVVADNYPGLNKEFLHWFRERCVALGDYVFFLEELGCDFKKITTAEVGKTGYDSIVLPFDSKLITVYDNKLDINQEIFNRDRLELGKMIVSEYNPKVIYLDPNKNSKWISPYDIDTFVTQNIYNDNDINGWHHLHNSGVYNIIVGAYGNIYDKDMSSKIKRLKDLKQEFIDDYYCESYTTFKDRYYYVIYSNWGPHETKIRVRS